MNTELLSQTRQAEIEREVAQLRMAAAAREAQPVSPTAVPTAAEGRQPAISLRLLRALGLTS